MKNKKFKSGGVVKHQSQNIKPLLNGEVIIKKSELQYVSIVRQKLIKQKGYTPYCSGSYRVCGLPRMVFDGKQFECPICDYKTNFPIEFIREYKSRWGLN